MYHINQGREYQLLWIKTFTKLFPFSFQMIFVIALRTNAPVIWNPGPYGAADSEDIAGLKCRDLTSDESRQCRRCEWFKLPAKIQPGF